MWLQWTKRYRLCRLNSWNIRKNFNGCERDDLNGQLERKLASQLAIHINGLDSAYRLLTAWLSFGKLCFSSVALVGVFCIELNGFTFCAILRHLGVFLGDESTRSIVFTERGFQSLRLSFSLSLSLCDSDLLDWPSQQHDGNLNAARRLLSGSKTSGRKTAVAVGRRRVARIFRFFLVSRLPSLNIPSRVVFRPADKWNF